MRGLCIPTRQLRDFKKKFETVEQHKDHILKELKKQLPHRPVMDIRYFEGLNSYRMARGLHYVTCRRTHMRNHCSADSNISVFST